MVCTLTEYLCGTREAHQQQKQKNASLNYLIIPKLHQWIIYATLRAWSDIFIFLFTWHLGKRLKTPVELNNKEGYILQLIAASKCIIYLNASENKGTVCALSFETLSDWDICFKKTVLLGNQMSFMQAGSMWGQK